MTKKEFLDILTESLAGNVPANEIEENIRYYKEYIEHGEESEEKALENLGDPHLIAKTIIDSFKASKGPMADFYTEQARTEYSQSASENEREYNSGYEQYDSRSGYRFKWHEKALIILVLIAVGGMLLFLGGLAAFVIVRVVLPIAVILLIIKLIMDYFGRG